jgi:hypothetical protein
MEIDLSLEQCTTTSNERVVYVVADEDVPLTCTLQMVK